MRAWPAVTTWQCSYQNHTHPRVDAYTSHTHRAAGIYADTILDPNNRTRPSACRWEDANGDRRSVGGGAPARMNAILLTTSNYGYSKLTLAWMCRARSLGLKYVVHCQDKMLYEFLAKSSGNHPELSFFYESSLSGSDELGEFGDLAYIKSTCLKLTVQMAIMNELRYDIFFSDPDIGTHLHHCLAHRYIVC